MNEHFAGQDGKIVFFIETIESEVNGQKKVTLNFQRLDREDIDDLTNAWTFVRMIDTYPVLKRIE